MAEEMELIKPDDVKEGPFIFVSYSRKDMEEVQEVLKILRRNHFRFWYDMGLKSGAEWAEELGEKIDSCEQFLVLLSPNSMQSKYVRKEISMAVDIKSAGNICVLYLQETRLSKGLHLLLDDIQALFRHAYAKESDFEQVLCEAASNNTLKNDRETSTLGNCDEDIGTAQREFRQQFELHKLIGMGGVSSVYLATQRKTGALVAVKYGQIDRTYRGSITLECFRREREILAQTLNNICPFVPAVLDCFVDEENIYMVETYIDGKTLEQKEEDSQASEEEVVQIAIKVLNILKRLHMQNVVYRDIKPGNLIKNEMGDIYLIDFNCARVLENPTDQEIALGTIGYAPPEQFITDGSKHTSFASDIYSLGRTMEYLLFPRGFARKEQGPVRYYRRDVSVELEAIIHKMTHQEQEQRYQSAEEVLTALENYKCRNIFRKLFMYQKSEKRIKEYRAFNAEKQKVREQNIAEMVKVQEQENVGDSYYDTVILPKSDTVLIDEKVTALF